MEPLKPIAFDCVDHINMFVKDLAESITFYRMVFGTDAEIKQDGFAKGIRWCIIGIPNKFYFCLYELKGKDFDTDALHINHIGFYVPDFDETVRRVELMGIPVEYQGKAIEWRNRNGT